MDLVQAGQNVNVLWGKNCLKQKQLREPGRKAT